MKPVKLSTAAFIFLALGIVLIAIYILWHQDNTNSLYLHLGVLCIAQSMLVLAYRMVEGDLTVKALHQAYLSNSGRLANKTFFNILWRYNHVIFATLSGLLVATSW